MERLHLGCGENYLKGYTNIDFPSEEHSVQKTSVADRVCDIRQLSFPKGAIEEIRLHHVFEHFTRPASCALIVAWSYWLRPGGLLRIEVPNVGRMSRHLIWPFSSNRTQALAMRHVFGSHEAGWAVHSCGYTPRTIRVMLEHFGYKVRQIKLNHWKGTHNLEVFAENSAKWRGRDYARGRAQDFFAMFLVDNSDSELRLLESWLEQFDWQIETAKLPSIQL